MEIRKVIQEYSLRPRPFSDRQHPGMLADVQFEIIRHIFSFVLMFFCLFISIYQTEEHIRKGICILRTHKDVDAKMGLYSKIGPVLREFVFENPTS